MKKHILINLLIKTLLFGFVFAYVSCSEELYNHEHDEHKRTKKVNLSELPMLQNTINQRKANMRGAEDSLAVYLTLINPENILMVDAPDGSKHYTFSLQINQEEKLTNLVIKEKEEQYDYNLVKYTSDNYQQWITDIKDVGYSTILPNVDVTEFNKFHEVCFIYKWECPWGIHDLSNVFACEETNLKYWTVTAVQVPCVGETSGGGGSSSGTSGSSSGSSSTGGSSYGGSSGNNYTVITSPTPCTTCPEIDNPDEINEPCTLINKIEADINFKGRMAGLLNAARNWSFESCHVLYNDPAPAATNNYTYQTFQGSIGEPAALYTGNTLMQGVIHSHYAGLVSIFSAGDLQDLYDKMKIPDITDNFFIAVVTAQNTAYLLQITDRNAFIAFGDKYLADEKQFEKFSTKIMANKFGVFGNGSATANELGFLKMMHELNMGVSLASANISSSTPATASAFDNWTQKVYNPQSNNSNSLNCN